MAKISKTIVDKDLRDRVFEQLFGAIHLGDEDGWNKINDRQMGIVMVDANNNFRYVRVGVIVAEEREDMTAQELMQKEIDEYNAKQAEKAEKAKKKAEKIAKDKAKREQQEDDDDSNQYLPNEVTM